MRKNKGKRNFIIVLSSAVALMVLASFIFIILITGTGEEQPESEIITGNEAETEHDDGSRINTDTEPLNTPAPAPEPVNEPVPLPSNTISVVDIADFDPELLKALDEEAKDHNCVAVSLVIYEGFAGNYYVYQYGDADTSEHRRADKDTKYRIASLSKLVTAICAMMLADEGKLDLDEDISIYLGYNVRNPNYPNTPVTSRMLMQHTSSVHDSGYFYDSIMGRERASTQNLLGRGSTYLDTRPGSVYEYSNFGYAILGAVCEFISGEKLDAFARRILFDPLDIDAGFLARNLNDTSNIAAIYDSGHSLTRSVDAQINSVNTGDIGQDQHLAQGSLMISAFDYAKILAMLGNGGVFRNERILSQESVIEIHNTDVEGPEYKQGLSTRFSDDGSFMPDEGFYWHTGSAYGIFAQYIYIAGSGPDEGISGTDTSRGVVVITTGASTNRSSNGMINVCTHLSAIAWQGVDFER